ncbi:2S seed storage albumin protein [Euphorbia peplus]|nr:2S seed storage albumin protein [Euphorbia peplus]
MAKLVAIIALMSSLLVLLAESSSAYRTIVTTVEIDNPTGSQSCRQEARRSDLVNCRHFIRLQRRSAEEMQMRQCCDELKEKVRDECQCEAFKYAAEQELQDAREEESRSSMKQRAREFPARCGIQQCEIRVGFF